MFISDAVAEERCAQQGEHDDRDRAVPAPQVDRPPGQRRAEEHSDIAA